MSKIDFHISGFKCFADNHFELNKVTLLTGANASGKSSVIQALLLLKAASENVSSSPVVDLNDKRYAFDFGYPDSLINSDSTSDKVNIALGFNGEMSFKGEEQRKERKLYIQIDHQEQLASCFANDFVYFCAERQGPRFEYLKSDIDTKTCGCHGENTGNVVSENWPTKIDGKRLRTPNKGEVLFNIALDDWVDYIFPGISIRIQQVGSQTYQVIVRDKNHNINTNAINIGFGISYALPILTGALLAKDDSWLVVENPEAHLHAKAQSNMGYFLGIMAASGMRVVVETHSEHIVNGVRRAAITSGRLVSEDVNIYFFKGKDERCLITMDEQGNLSDFPVDFFDQARQDMLEIINVVHRK